MTIQRRLNVPSCVLDATIEHFRKLDGESFCELNCRYR
jgi:hypothetical protein